MNALLARQGDRPPYNVTLAVLVVAALAFAFSQTMIVPALPAIEDQLEVSQTTVTFVFTAFLLTASVATPIVGRLGDMFGKERLLVITLAIFAAGSLVAALTHSITGLIAGRAIQGVAGAVFPLAFGIIRDEFPPERVPGAIGLLSATFGIGGGGGLVLSGVIVDHLDYEWIFWLSLVVVVIAGLAARRWVPESPVKSPARIDWAGAALLGAGLVALLIGVSQGNAWGWGSARILGLFALSVAILLAWVRLEQRTEQPMVDMRMMRDRTVAGANLTAVLVGFGMFGSFILIPQLVQTPPSAGYGFGASVTQAGLFMLPSAVIMLFAGPMSGWLGNRFGARLPLLAGTAISCLSYAFMAVEHSHPWSIYASSLLLGLGIGLSFAAMANLVVGAVDQRQTGVATGMNTIMRTIGGSLGGQVAASVVAGSVVASGSVPSESGFVLAFLMSAVGLAIAFCAALTIPAGAGERVRVRRAAAQEPA